MFFSSLLDVSLKTTQTVKWVSLSAVFLLLGIIAAISFRGRKHYDAKRLAFAGISVGLSFALSYAKFSPLAFGGSITLASFVPILIYTYVYGAVDGLLAGCIFGLLNFVSGPYILTPVTFILDYILAFSSIALMGFAKKFTGKQTFNVVLGTVLVYAARFFFHLISGVIYFMNNAIWVDLPAWALKNSFIYSFIYQCVYIPADCLIATIVLYLLAKFKVLDRLIGIIKPKEKIAVPADHAQAQESPAEEPEPSPPLPEANEEKKD